MREYKYTFHGQIADAHFNHDDLLWHVLQQVIMAFSAMMKIQILNAAYTHVESDDLVFRVSLQSI